MNIQAIIFDFGGVLIQMKDNAPRLALAERFGIPPTALDELVFYSESARRAALGELTIEQHWEAIRARLGITPNDLPGVIHQFWAADGLNEELIETIHGLRPQYKIGLLSNAWDDLRQALNEQLHISYLFDDLVISAEVGMVKPDPRIYELAAQRLSIKPAEAVFIDDTERNVVAARSAGWHAIHYRDNEQTLADLDGLLKPVIMQQP